MNPLIAATLLLAGLTGCTIHWSYSGSEGPAHWAELSENYSACGAGKNQSPINLHNQVGAELAPLSFNYPAAATEIINNGHTIQINIAEGSKFNVADETFELKQFHFHTPSENLISGESFPLEAHFVHADTKGNLAVVAVMFKAGTENLLISDLWAIMPDQAGEKVDLANANIEYINLLPENIKYYRYNGSLTTPPCTEGVRWFVIKQAINISIHQVQHFLQVMQHQNNRPVQPLNARLILK